MCPLGFQLILGFQETQIVPDIGKHRAKQELETVPPRKLEILPLWGAQSDPKSGTETNSPVTLDLLVAAVKWNFQKGGTVVQNMTFRHIYICVYGEGLIEHLPFEFVLPMKGGG